MKKVLFVYRSPRRRIYQDIEKGIEPDHLLYGLNYLKKDQELKVSFSDIAYSNLNLLFWIILPLQNFLIRQSSLGFKLDQALLLLPYIWKSDILITTADSAGLPILFLKKLGIFKKPVIYISTGLANELEVRKSSWIYRLYLNLLEQTSGVIVHSLIEKELFNQMNPKLSDKTFFIPFGVDADYFKKDRKQSNYILSVGQDKSRDFTLLAQLAARMPDQEFVIITQKANIQNIQFSKNVKLLFNLPYTEVRDYLLKAKLVIVPLKELNRASGQMSFLEALASGNKTVVANVKGIKEIYPLVFRTKASIFTYEPGNLNELYKSVQNALEYNGNKDINFPKEYSSLGYYENIEKIIDNL